MTSLLSAASVGRILDMTTREVYSAAAQGQLGPVVKIGRRVRFHAAFIETLVGEPVRRGSVRRGKGNPGAPR